MHDEDAFDGLAEQRQDGVDDPGWLRRPPGVGTGPDGDARERPGHRPAPLGHDEEAATSAATSGGSARGVHPERGDRLATARRTFIMATQDARSTARSGRDWSKPIRLAASAMPNRGRADHGVALEQLGGAGLYARRRRGRRPRAPRRAPGHLDPLQLTERRLAVLDEDVRDGPRTFLTIASSLSWNATPRRSARARPVTVFPEPGGPTMTATGRSALTMTGGARNGREVPVVVAGRLRDAVAAELLHAGQASTSATASATTPAAGTAHTSERWWIALAGSSPAMSTVSSERGTVEIGFMAASPEHLTGRHAPLGTSGAPVRPDRPGASRSISSWACEPRGGPW